MRILHVLPGLADSSGPTQAVACLAAAQVRGGHQVQIAAVAGRGTDPSSQGFRETPLALFPSRVLRYWGYAPSLSTWLKQSLASFDFVHVHSLWLYPNLAASRACVAQGVPYWVRPAGSLEPWCMQLHSLRKQLYLRLLERKVIDRSAGLHAVSEQEAHNLGAFGFRAPVGCIPNGVSDQFLEGVAPREGARRQLGIPADAPVVLFLSRIHPKKGLDLLQAAFEQVLREHPRAILLVAGPNDHEYGRQVMRAYEHLVRAGSVRFLGEKTGAEKGTVFSASDVFVLPSHSENFGIAVAEAMAAGVPVVTSRNTPWRVLEEEGAGFWEELTVDAFSARINWLFRNRAAAVAMGARGQALARTRFSWDAIASQVVDSYQTTGTAWRQRARVGVRL